MPYHSTKKQMDKVPKGFHKMRDGSIMKGDKHPTNKNGYKSKEDKKSKKNNVRDMKAKTTKKTVGDCGCGCGGLKPTF